MGNTSSSAAPGWSELATGVVQGNVSEVKRIVRKNKCVGVNNGGCQGPAGDDVFVKKTFTGA